MILTKLLRNFIFRQALLYTALSLVSMLVLLGFIYWATAGYMDDELDATIEEETLGLSEQYRIGGVIGLSAIIEERVSLNPRGPAIYLLADEDFQPIVGNLDAWPGRNSVDYGWTRFSMQRPGKKRTTQYEVRARTFDFEDGLHLLVGRDTGDLERTRALILNAMAWGIFIIVVLALGVGLFMSSRVMRRIDAINQTSREIMEGDLSRRIPVAGSGDDFDKLARNLNRMLERIESLMLAVHQVSDNIAHDLRTPLSRLRTRLEEVRSSSDDEIPSQLDKAIGDADELLATFNALLRIARIESGSSGFSFTTLDLASLARDVAELYEPVAVDKGQELVIEEHGIVLVEGDQHLLFQLLANLVENAIRHTPPGTKIVLTTSATPAGPELQVADNGPGIPAALQEKVFQRFFRADASRSTPGSGLGLSLVRAVAELHHGRVELADNTPGLRVTITF